MTVDYPKRTPRRVLWLLVAAVALIGVGVVLGVVLLRPDPARVVLPDGSTLQEQAASQAALPTCAEVFRPGETIDDARARAGCRDRQGQVQVGSYGTCQDGRNLYSVDASTGAPAGWGFGGDVYHATPSGDVAGDPGYAAAYGACRS